MNSSGIDVKLKIVIFKEGFDLDAPRNVVGYELLLETAFLQYILSMGLEILHYYKN